MFESSQGSAGPGLGGNILLRKNELVFFALNLLLVWPYALSHYSPIGCGLAGAVLMVMFLFVVWRSGQGVPVIRDLPLMMALDACIPLVLNYQQAMYAFDPDDIEYVLSGLAENVTCLLLLAAGVALRFIKFKPPLLVWMKGLSKAAIGASIVLALCSGPMSYMYGGFSSVIFIRYLMCAAAWCVLCALSYYVDGESFARNNWLSRVLLAALAVICLTELQLLQTFIRELLDWNYNLYTESMAWWRVALSVVLMVGGAIAAYDYDRSRMGVDSLFLGALAGGTLLRRVMMDFPFRFSQVLLLIYLAGSFCCFLNELKQQKTLRLSSPAYLIAQTGAALLSAFLMYDGLWMPLILLILYGAVFYVTAGKMNTPMRRQVWWLTMLSFPAALSAALQWHDYFAIDSFLLLAASYVVLAFAIIILNWPQLDRQRTSPNVYKWIICGFMTVLSLLAALR